MQHKAKRERGLEGTSIVEGEEEEGREVELAKKRRDEVKLKWRRPSREEGELVWKMAD